MPTCSQRCRSSVRDSRRQSDDPGIGKRWILADLLGQRETVHFRHVDVGQHQRERASFLADLAEQRQRLVAASRALGRHPPVGHDQLQDLTIGRIVIDHQHRCPSEGAGVGQRAFRFGRRSDPQPHREVKSAALLHGAFHPDTPLHHFHQRAGDGEAQPGTAEVPSRGGVHLLEGFEDRRQLVRRDADPRIADGDVQDNLGFVMRLAGHLQHDFALFRELDGVPDQIDDDLPQSNGISLQNSGT
jgi:hypothetical protein